MELNRVSSTDDELTHPQSHDHSKLVEGCWCRDATNLMEVKSVQDLISLVRFSVREEIEKTVTRLILPYLPSLHVSALLSTSRSVPHEVGSSASRRLKLHFVGTLPETLLTLTEIVQDESTFGIDKRAESCKGKPLQVELLDDSGKRVEEGDESSATIKLFVLDGDFEAGDWTEEEFHRNVVPPRKGRPPLLGGECEISMSNGVALISNIWITDNSKGIRSEKFRLGAQVIKGLPPRVVTRAAVSKAFRVKERRSQGYQKFKKPSLGDPVWRLENIRKGGPICQKLEKENVCTLKDFLQLYHTNANELKNILHICEKRWHKTVENAESSELSDECYEYCDEMRGVVLRLNCVFKILNVTFQGQNCQPYEELDRSQKELVNELRRTAYKNRRNLQKINASTTQILEQSDFARPSSNTHTNMHYPDSLAYEKQSELCNIFAPSSRVPMQAEVAGPSSIMNTNMHCPDTSASEKQCGLQQISSPTNQIAVLGEFAWPSNCLDTNMQCVSNAIEMQSGQQIDSDFLNDFHGHMNTGESGLPVNYGPPSLTQYGLYEYLSSGNSTGPTLDSNVASFCSDVGCFDFPPLPEESGAVFKASANENITLKLRSVCYATKAALMFMIAVQQDQTPARKKQKL